MVVHAEAFLRVEAALAVTNKMQGWEGSYRFPKADPRGSEYPEMQVIRRPDVSEIYYELLVT